MAILRLMAGEEETDGSKYRPYINTGTSLDIVSGKYIPNVNGTWTLSGGMGITNSFIGGPNTFKSTCNNGALINGMARFPDSQGFMFDSEFSLDKRRTANFSNLHLDDPEKREAQITDITTRLEVYDPTTTQGESLDHWFDYLKEIRDFKVKHHKDYEVETEILDQDTGKPYRMLLPTFIGIDSWSEAHVMALNNKNEEIDADTEMSKQRTVFMEEGLKKAMLMRQLPKLCAQGGFVVNLTGHMGVKMGIDGKPVKKDMTYMGQGETVKAMGPKFLYLMSNIFQINKASALVGTDRSQSEYPADGGVSNNELQELMVTLIRSKNAPSGSQTQLVSSQRLGVMAGLSNYHHLRSNKCWGLGSPNKVRSPLLGDKNIGRTKIFDASQDYKISRALELTYQLFFIQTMWSMSGQPVDYSIPIEVFAEKLMGSGYAIDDILNSRGWWTYKGAPGVERPYLSMPDILNIISGDYKPKFFAVTK